MRVWWLLGARLALAGDWGAVEALWWRDPDGALRPVSDTAEGERRRAEQSTALSLDLDLAAGDTVTTQDARARLRVSGDQQIILEPHSAITLEAERSVLQELGEALYRVQGIFNVRYGSVEAAVEGTLFRVEITEDGRMLVEVLEGQVRVTSEGEETVLRRGEQSAVVLGAAPGPATAAPRQPLLPRGGDPRRALGDGRFTVGLYGGVSSYEDGGGLVPSLGSGGTGASWRTVVGYRVAPRWRLTADLGTVTANQRFFVPTAVGLEQRRGVLRFGGAATVLLGACGCEGEQVLDFRVGATGVAGITLPVIAGFSVEARSRLGATVSTRTDEPAELLYDLAAGVSWGW